MPKRSSQTRPELAETLGIGNSTVGTYSREESFPAGTETEGVIRHQTFAVVVFYLVNKATKSERREVMEALSESLGLNEDRPWSAADEKEQLDLRTREAKLERELGNQVRIDDVKGILERFGAALNDALETVESSTGQPVAPIIDPVFAEVQASLEKLRSRR